MRTIKFRAWQVENKQMIDADSLAFDFYEPLCDQLRDSDEIKFMQYTGLKDKDSFEIYEDDFVSFDVRGGDNGETPVKNQKGVVTISPSGVAFGNWCYEWVGNINLLGNIHNNPELLKVMNYEQRR